jgi:hypothetical protein
MERNTILIKAHLLRAVVLITMVYSTLSAAFGPSTLRMSGKDHSSRSPSSLLWHAARSRQIHAMCHKTNSTAWGSRGQSLNRDQMRRIISENLEAVNTTEVVVIVLASFPFRKLLTNWICHARRVGMTKFLVIPLDPQLDELLKLEGIPHLPQPDLSVDSIGDFGTACYRVAVCNKVRIIGRILSLGFNTCLLDVDIAFQQNPLTAMLTSSSGGGDIILSTNAPQSEWNTGAMLIRYNTRTLALMTQWLLQNLKLVEEPAGQMYHGTQRILTDLLTESCGLTKPAEGPHQVWLSLQQAACSFSTVPASQKEQITGTSQTSEPDPSTGLHFTLGTLDPQDFRTGKLY